jgi:hypothetical protein
MLVIGKHHVYVSFQTILQVSTVVYLTCQVDAMTFFLVYYTFNYMIYLRRTNLPPLMTLVETTGPEYMSGFKNNP